MLYKYIIIALQSSLLSPSFLSAPILPVNLILPGPVGEVYPLEPGGVTGGFTTEASDSPISLNVSANSAAMRGRPEPLFHPCLTIDRPTVVLTQCRHSQRVQGCNVCAVPGDGTVQPFSLSSSSYILSSHSSVMFPEP